MPYVASQVGITRYEPLQAQGLGDGERAAEGRTQVDDIVAKGGGCGLLAEGYASEGVSVASNATGKSIFDSSCFPRGFSTYASCTQRGSKRDVQAGSVTIWEPKMDQYDSVLTIVQRFLWVYWLLVITGNTRCEGMPGVQNMRWVAGT